MTRVHVFEPVRGPGTDEDVRDATGSPQGTPGRVPNHVHERPEGRDAGCGRAGRRSRDRRRAGPLTSADVAALIDEYQRTGDRSIRNRVVESRLEVADHQVVRFSRSVGVSPDDLRQTALVAMIRAVDRFDSSRGVTFRTFASRTIEGELKRHLRDRAWTVRPPRQAQELHLRVRRASEELCQRLGRAPTIREIADDLATEVDRVREAMRAGQARTASGLEAPGQDGEETSSLVNLLGQLDDGYGSVDDRLVVHDAVEALDDRQQLVLRLRYVDELTQPEIAEEVGLSQSYVSRILRCSLEQLRSGLAA